MRPPVETNSGLSAVLRGVVADMQHASGADIVSIFLYEEATHTYYAPFATGQPQESLLDSLTDMREQLARYLTDAEQGKVPDELGVHQYGSTVWLTVTRQRLIARNAPSEIDSTFIRRYQVQSTIGLPLLAGDRLLGLVYLNYRNQEKAPDDSALAELERRATAAAMVVQAVLAGAERTALEGLARLTGTVRAAVRRIREPGVPDNAHLNMLRHVIEKRHPAVGILSIREAIRANQRVRELEALAVDLLARGEWTSYAVGTRPTFEAGVKQPAQQAIGTKS